MKFIHTLISAYCHTG